MVPLDVRSSVGMSDLADPDGRQSCRRSGIPVRWWASSGLPDDVANVRVGVEALPGVVDSTVGPGWRHPDVPGRVVLNDVGGRGRGHFQERTAAARRPSVVRSCPHRSRQLQGEGGDGVGAVDRVVGCDGFFDILGIGLAGGDLRRPTAGGQ